MVDYTIEQLADKLPITTVEWQLARWDEYSGLGTGEVMAAQLAPPRWSAKVTLAPMYHDRAANVQARIEALDGAINNFFLFVPQKQFPVYDPDGNKLGLSEPKIDLLGANNKSLSIKDLPAGYQLTTGDMMAVSYGVNPVRRYLGRIVTDATTSANGFTGNFEVRPHLPAGIAVNLFVTLIKPAAKVFIIPNTFNPGTAEGLFTTGMSFEVMQRP
ncbi:hypothetical protein [Brucella pituitosa]|uniref:hypothetical protein n=1 Tax=Brucella pituitosa TaxID=571256 RepID=UPI003F4AA13A